MSIGYKFRFPGTVTVSTETPVVGDTIIVTFHPTDPLATYPLTYSWSWANSNGTFDSNQIQNSTDTTIYIPVTSNHVGAICGITVYSYTSGAEGTCIIRTDVVPMPDPAKGYWYAPRRYDLTLPSLSPLDELRKLTKSYHLNYTIKRLMLMTLKDVSGYWVEGTKLHTVPEDDIVDTTWVPNTGVIVRDNKLLLN